VSLALSTLAVRAVSHGRGQNAKPLVRDFKPAVVVLQQAPAGPLGKRIKNIAVDGLLPEATEELLASLPAHAGDTLTLKPAEAVSRAAKGFDEHLRMGSVGSANDEVTIAIRLSP
jgi:hypothetical protein